MNIKKLNRIAKEIKANKDKPAIVEVRGWKYNRMVQGVKIYGWVTERESASLLKREKK